MEGKNWGKFETYKCKLENKYNKLFIRWQKAFMEEKSKEWTKKRKDKDNKLNETNEYMEKIREIKKAQKWKANF